MTVQEPSLWPQFFLIWVLPFLAYFGGICIRKFALSGPDSPSVTKQLVLGIPIALLAVSPLLSVLHQTISTHVPTYLFTLGVIMEQAIVFHETAISHWRQRTPEK